MEFSAASSNIHNNGNLDAIDLANKIEGKRADLHAGFIAENSFKKYLFELLADSWVANQTVVVVYSSHGRVTAQESNTSNGPQIAQLRPAPPVQTMLPVIVELVASH
jgi:hypothetical protein